MPALTGGSKLLSYLRTMGNKIKNAVGADPLLRVGILEGATYDDGTSVAMVAALQEFGAPAVGIPPRPFFRTMVKAHKDAWGPGLGGLLTANDFNANRSLNGLGQVIAGQLRQSIVDVTAPPLSPTTLMLRKMKQQDPTLRDTMTYSDVVEARARVAAGRSYAGVSTKPLVDTGVLLKSISWQVVKT